MKLIVGLGNFGAEYAKTRHNIGFMTIDIIAEKMSVDFSKEKFHANIAETVYNGEKVMLMKPLTYMNRSGLAVGEAMNFYKLETEDLLVIYDDMDMQCGQLKIKKKGSGGGHRGMGDIIMALSTDVISRIKVGIDHPVHDKVVDFVLKPFNEEENEKIQPALKVAAEAAIYWIENGTQEAMNVYNGYGKSGAQKPKAERETIKNQKQEIKEPVKTEAEIKAERENDPKFLAMLKSFFGGKK